MGISVNQIEKWLQESPYSQPLRTLLAKKLHYNKDIVLDPALANAATMSGNRTWLYRELHSKVDFKTEDNVGKTIPTVALAAGAIASAQKEQSESTNSTSDDSLSKPIQSVDNQEITNKLIENKPTQEVIFEEVLSTPNQADLEPTIATLDINPSEPKLIDLEQSALLDHKAINELKVQIIGPDEEFIVSKKKDKKEKKRKKDKKRKKEKKVEKVEKVEKDKSKKEKKSKDKKSKTVKKSDKKKGKKSKKKTSKVKRSDKQKKAEKKKAKRKALAEYWDNKVGTITPPPEYLESEKSNSKRRKKKKSSKKKNTKIKLSKYDISVSPSEEEANQYNGNLDDASDYTQWLMTFGKDRNESSLRHMTTHTSKKGNKVKEISFSAKESTKKQEKKAKKKKKSKVKNKTKADESLDTNEEIISELWADLLAKQGHIKKARKMYLKLSLKYPEKSSYFAAKSENL